MEALEKNGYKENHQTVVAKLIGIKQPSVHLWAKGRTMPSMSNVVELATKLHVDANWLLTNAKTKKKPHDIDQAASELMAMWPKLSDITKGRLLGIASQSIQETTRGADDQTGDDQVELHPPAN
ncbi:MAG TPA: helix-turn-helix transcriptional regulator [Steroidobacteraceae bacterium]